MKELLYNLCDNRSVFVPIDKVEEFITFTNQHNIYPEGGIRSETELCFYLNHPITKEEALIIADKHRLKGVVEEDINSGISPFDALSKWNIND